MVSGASESLYGITEVYSSYQLTVTWGEAGEPGLGFPPPDNRTTTTTEYEPAPVSLV
ncbi:MAG: hypothetical protein ACE5H4_05150 [Candidatus Thorarchaeota archaeon]